MSVCKYCVQETGGSMFCQNCGAKVEQEAQPVPGPVVQNQPGFQPSQAPIQPQSYSTIPTQPNYYTPGGAGGLLAGNIIAIILGVICCCFTSFISAITMILGIIGTVFASKVKSSTSAEEEKHNRKVSCILMIIAFVFLLIGIGVMIASIAMAGEGIGDFGAIWSSVYESVSLSMEEAEGLLHI